MRQRPGNAGFERNIFPTLFLFFVGREVIQTEHDYERFIKIVSIFALVALAYGLKHSLSGLWGFEQAYFSDKYFAEGLEGWLTIGIKGIEFRTFGVFFGYMEFTFTAALWGTLLLSHDYNKMDNRSAFACITCVLARADTDDDDNFRTSDSLVCKDRQTTTKKNTCHVHGGDQCHCSSDNIVSETA